MVATKVLHCKLLGLIPELPDPSFCEILFLHRIIKYIKNLDFEANTGKDCNEIVWLFGSFGEKNGEKRYLCRPVALEE